MKPKNRLLAIIPCLLMIFFCVVGLTACLEIDTCSHQWSEWSVGVEATCKEKGVQKSTCTECGEIKTSVIEATGHDWVAPTCSAPRTCKNCLITEDEPLGHTPNADDGDCTTPITCSVCNEITTKATASHTGGTATCKQKASCSVCGKLYGAFAEHTPNADDGDCTTAITCSLCGQVTTAANASHTGGTATCKQKANCSVCGKTYGTFAGHTPNADDGDCTTAITCSVCGQVTTAANANHTGGAAACGQRPECAVCGKAYGQVVAHIGEPMWVKRLDSHYRVYSCCHARISDPVDHTIVHGTCTECGFKPTISIDSAEVSPGDTQVEIAISVKDNPGIAGLMLTLQYSSDVLTLTNARNGEALDALTYTAPSTLNNSCTFLWDSTGIDDEDIKDGEFLILTFDISSTAPEGNYSILLKISAYDNEVNPFTFIIEGGRITVNNQ